MDVTYVHVGHVEEDMHDDVGLAFRSIVAALLGVLLIWPPSEFVSAGFTFETLFYKLLGNPNEDIVGYLSRKVVLNRSLVASLPGIYAIHLYFTYSSVAYSMLAIYEHLAFDLLIGAALYFFYHYLTGFTRLRPVQDLLFYSPNLRTLAAQITAEYNDFNNFTVSFAHSNKFVVSESWVFNITRFNFSIINLRDVSFEAVQAVSHQLNLEGHDEMHFVTIEAVVTNQPIKGFRFRVLAEQFRDLQAKVEQPIGIARNVILRQTLNERFVQAFIGYITDNPKYLYTNLAELECFGCSAEAPNVKITLRCNRNVEGERRCRECFCRPMWCVGCMARVFASKQDQARPELWLDGQATCPTCRAEFCVQDVSFVVATEEEL